MGWPVRVVGSEGRPISLGFVGFVGNRPFHDQDERRERAFRRQVEALQKFVAVFVGQKEIVKVDLGNPRQVAENQVFDAGLRRGRDRDGVAVTTQSGVDPEDVDFFDRSCCACQDAAFL